MTIQTTLGEHGALAIGLGPSREQSVVFKRWGIDDDLELGKILEEHPGLSAAEYTSHVLAHFLIVFGGHAMDEMKLSERLGTISMAPMADVLTAWALLRRKAMGDAIDLPIECGHCQAKFDYRVSLGSLSMKVAEPDEALTRVVALEEPIRFRGENVQRMILGPTKWKGYCLAAKDRGNIMAVRVGLLFGSIEGFEDSSKKGLPTEVEIRSQISKSDFETLLADIEAHTHGPNFEIELKCPECRRKITDTVPWPYASFFSRRASSREGASKPSATPSVTSPTEVREG